MEKICCRWAPSLGELEGTHQDAWGTKDYVYATDKYLPTVFFGLYDLRDYLALWRHAGPKWVLWAGSDLENLVSGFLFNDGKLKWLSRLLPINFWLIPILRRATHFVEDNDEAVKLFTKTGLTPSIAPSFLGNIEYWSNPKREYYHLQKPQVYLSLSQGREVEYGLNQLLEIAPFLPDTTFHVYGSDSKPADLPPNIKWHGRVSKHDFNLEIRYYQCGLRLNRHDGFSEITAKSVLMGQYPITYLSYPMIPNATHKDQLIDLLHSLKGCTQPNRKAREYYIQALNNYPWNVKKHSAAY